MNGASHKKTTQKAFDIFCTIAPNNPLLPHKNVLVQEVANVDRFQDVEFVDVEGGWFDNGRDDPHESSAWDDDDIAHYQYGGSSFTAFNHFIDIKKGPGLFDDYDGYSYAKGSASREQYQDADDITTGFWDVLLANATGMKVDEGLNWWFNDEYVHVPGNPWYRGCSPAVERYSYPQDKGIYSSKEAELLARFPLASSIGHPDQGIPYSVFLPVDNLARYWYSSYLNTRNPRDLSPVMHAIQDASIPHHAAGYMGNWHANYEDDVNQHIDGYLNDAAVIGEATQLFFQWCSPTQIVPQQLRPEDWQLTPAANWQIDQLVTWMALIAYREYATTYHHFSNGYHFNSNSAKRLMMLALAVSLLALAKATDFVVMPPEVMAIALG